MAKAQWLMSVMWNRTSSEHERQFHRGLHCLWWSGSVGPGHLWNSWYVGNDSLKATSIVSSRSYTFTVNFLNLFILKTKTKKKTLNLVIWYRCSLLTSNFKTFKIKLGIQKYLKISLRQLYKVWVFTLSWEKRNTLLMS